MSSFTLPKNRKTRCNRGAVLLEALLSVIVMAIALTAVMESLTSSYKVALINKDYLFATFLAQDQMVDLIASGRASSGSGNYPQPFDRFEYESSGTAASMADAKFLNELTLKISWSTGRQKNELPVTTLVFDLPDEEK